MPTPDFAFFGPDEGVVALSGATVVGSSTTAFQVQAASDTTSFWLLTGTGTASVTFDVSSGALSDIYINTCLQGNSTTSPANGFFQIDGPTHPLFRLYSYASSENWRAELWDGAAWVQVGSDVTTDPISIYSRFDIRLNIANSGGRVVVSKDNSLYIDFTGDTLLSTDTTVADLIVQKGDTNIETNWAYVLAHSADISLVRVVEDITSGDGTFQDLNSGSEGDVDEQYASATTNSFVSGTTAGQGSTFNMFALTSQFTINAIESVIVPMTVKPDTDPALYVKPRVRISSTNYDDTGIQWAAGTWHSQLTRYDTDPSTAVAWANAAAVDAAELGFVLSATP